MKSQEIGYWWLGENILDQNKELKGKIWYGICKKTRKLSVAGYLPIYPMMIQSTHISDGKCFDGNHCLNVDCEYANCNNLLDAIHKSAFADVNSDEHLIKFFEKSKEDIKNWFAGIDETELNSHFVDGLTQITISEEAFERIMDDI